MEVRYLIQAYVGLILVIFSPDLGFTNSLLIKMPVGWMYLRPLGAVSSIERSDMVEFGLLRRLLPRDNSKVDFDLLTRSRE